MTEVVAALIWDNYRFLACQRPAHKSRALLWEFVGGKNRYTESEAETLSRELDEELGIKCEVGRFLCSIDFVNNDILYHLKAYEVKLLEHSFSLSVHSEIKYVTKAELLSLDMVPSDFSLTKKLIEQGIF